MNILLIGSGGREHAIAWKLLQSPRLKKLYLTSPYAAVEILKQTHSCVERIFISEKEKKALIDFSLTHAIDLVIIGNEAPLANGLSDELRDRNIPVFGPSQAAATIESSKVFAKNFMQRHGIPTARYAVFSDYQKAQHYLTNVDYPIVIKASGLAAGKGVFLPNDLQEARRIVKQWLDERSLGVAADEIIIEERLQGEEISFLAFSDGITIKSMPLARDYKRLLDKHQGPNTGGMGAYAPVINILPAQIEAWADKILQSTINGLRKENKSFIGVLYAGLMITVEGPKVLEFNCRFGDPESQVLMPLLNSDLLDIMKACINRQLSACTIEWSKQTAISVILASQDYPAHPRIHVPITGLNEVDTNALLFYAGAKIENDTVFTAGGRVISIGAIAPNLPTARDLAYKAVDKIHFSGKQYRTDIGT